MNQETIDKISNDRIEMIVSLIEAVCLCGGNPIPSKWLDLTVRELINNLAQNGVRFCLKERKNVQ